MERKKPTPVAQPVRIAKALAQAGVASRRDADKLIAEGVVKVNGKVVFDPATKVLPTDKLMVEGQPVHQKPLTGAGSKPRLFLLNKPMGVMVTARDPDGRPTIYDMLPKRGLPRLIPVGRLDFNSEGLLLLTTDGDLAQKLMRPSSGIARKYRVRAFGYMSHTQMERIRDGVTIYGTHYQGADIELEHETDTKNKWYRVTLHEGKNREIRRMFEFFRCTVNRLIRTHYGPFKLTDLPPRAAMVEVPFGKLEKLMKQLEKQKAEPAGTAPAAAKKPARRTFR